MASNRDSTCPLEQVVAPIPSCALDEAGVRAQRARYARLAPGVVRVQREPAALVIEFREDFDPVAFDEALAVERACCPFFGFELDEGLRLLRTTVRDREQLAALDAIAAALGAATTRGTP